MKKITDIEIINAIKAGESVKEISVAAGVTEQAIYKRLKQLVIPEIERRKTARAAILQSLTDTAIKRLDRLISSDNEKTALKAIEIVLNHSERLENDILIIQRIEKLENK